MNITQQYLSFCVPLAQAKFKISYFEFVKNNTIAPDPI